MPIRRIFLDWGRTALVAAADYLIARFGSHGVLDLQDVVLAVPGGRAGRRLLEILVDRADPRGLAVVPPVIVTAGALPERLYQAKQPFADELVQQLAWIEALKKSEPQELERLALAARGDDDLLAQLAVGQMLGRLHAELAADGLDCDAVAARGVQIEGFREELRWRALAHVERRYLATLDGLELWDLQTARLYAVEHHECRTDKEIVLLGTVDLNRSVRQMLDQVAGRVTSLVFAPEALADRFDRYGCLLPDRWQDVAINLADDGIEVVDAPADQAKAVVRAIAALGGRYGAEQITVGVPDERIVPYVQQQLGQCGIAARYGAGVPIAQSPPRRLLAAVADYLEGGRFSQLAALVRLPAVDRWLLDQGIGGDWLSELDRYYSQHLPHRLDQQRLAQDTNADSIRQAHGAIQRWLAGLTEPAQPLDRWSRPIVDALLTIFGRSALDPSLAADRPVLVACEKIHRVMVAHRAVPESLAPKVTGSDAVRLVLRQIAAETIAPLADQHAVELLGWLELVLDDAPALVVTGLNEGIVPGSLNADLFLPNRLRRALGIEDNHRRYARDAYALSALAASRERLKLIAGRTAPEGEPLYPSRLLFACDGQTTARRVAAFFDPDAAPHRDVLLPGTLRPGVSRSQFEIPRPKPLAAPVTSMRVTEFRDYLACPYRYYLRHQLKLKPLEDQAEELDAAAFGSLMHDVLGDFGAGPAAASTDADEIRQFLGDTLDRIVRRRYGSNTLSAVGVQVEQLRARLAAFAHWQADWARQGWRIELVEQGPKEGEPALVVDGEPMALRGRIDRVDWHEASGRRIIFDYKSSDTPSDPDKAHRSQEGWTDLQLPLYRHLAAGMGIEGPIELGYIALSKDAAKVGESLADWTEEDLADADRAAAEVVRNVRAEVFWPPATPPPRVFQEFAAICQDNQFGPAAAAAVDDAEGDAER